jgi:hypothetical protein
MIDLETMGTQPGCVVLALGAVLFRINPDTENGYEELDRFYRTIDLKSSAAAGFQIDIDTLTWWLRDENREALAEQFADPRPIQDVLDEFGIWFQRGEDPAPDEPATIWSCGASFDLPILGWCYKALGGEPPWTHKQERCHRTMRELFGEGHEPEQVGTTHNAVDDAEFQARHLAALSRSLILTAFADL